MVCNIRLLSDTSKHHIFFWAVVEKRSVVAWLSALTCKISILKRTVLVNHSDSCFFNWSMFLWTDPFDYYVFPSHSNAYNHTSACCAPSVFISLLGVYASSKPTICRFWLVLCPFATTWLDLTVAILCAFPRFLRFAKPRNTEWNLR